MISQYRNEVTKCNASRPRVPGSPGPLRTGILFARPVSSPSGSSAFRRKRAPLRPVSIQLPLRSRGVVALRLRLKPQVRPRPSTTASWLPHTVLSLYSTAPWIPPSSHLTMCSLGMEATTSSPLLKARRSVPLNLRRHGLHQMTAGATMIVRTLRTREVGDRAPAQHPLRPS